MEYVTANGESVPAVGLGTWQLSSQSAYESVSTALDLGYRHVDTAQIYGNEDGVGDAIADSSVDRESVFLTTKVDPRHRRTEDIVRSVRDSLDRLGVEQVDLLLIHWPNPLASLESVIEGLNEAVCRGETRLIGVSNFGRGRLHRARTLSTAPIFTNQVLFHPWWPQRDLLRYCQEHDVLLTAYSPLATGGAVSDDLLAEIGAKYGKSGPQVAIRWATQHENVLTIPCSTARDHLAENIDIFDFKLTRKEHDRVTRPSTLRSGIAMVQGMLYN